MNRKNSNNFKTVCQAALFYAYFQDERVILSYARGSGRNGRNRMQKNQAIRKRKLRTWDEWYADAREYARIYGNLLVPRAYRTSEGHRLGRWIEMQRAYHNGVPSSRVSLSQLQIALLEQIGMVWKVEYRSEWEDWLKQAQKYYIEHGDLLVPRSYQSGRYSLGNWIQQRRKEYAEGRLDEDRIADLEACGMVWRVGPERRAWEDWLEDARAYYAEYGDLAAPQEYTTPEGRKLGRWLQEQRSRRGKRSDRPQLTEEQIEQLDAIGMIWDGRDTLDEAWERMYGWVADYKAAHGRLPTTRGVTAPDGRMMYAWIQTQQESLAAGTASLYRMQKLAQLGVTAPHQPAAMRRNASVRGASRTKAAV